MLVAGVGFEPTTSGLWVIFLISERFSLRLCILAWPEGRSSEEARGSLVTSYVSYDSDFLWQGQVVVFSRPGGRWLSFYEWTSSFWKTFVKWEKSLRFEGVWFCQRMGVTGWSKDQDYYKPYLSASWSVNHGSILFLRMHFVIFCQLHFRSMFGRLRAALISEYELKPLPSFMKAGFLSS